MVILNQELPQPKQREQEQALVLGDASHSSFNTLPPPPFDQSAGDPVVRHFSQHETYTAPGGEDPPAFAPYDASYFISGAGDIISHDPHLNEDGPSIAHFLRGVLTSRKVKRSIASYSLRQLPHLEYSCTVGGRTTKPIPAWSPHAMGIIRIGELSNTLKKLSTLILK